MTVLSAITLVIASIATLGCLLVGAGAALAENEELKNSALEFAMLAGMTSAVAAAATIIFAIVAVISIPETIAKLFTRTAASIVDPCFEEDTDFENESQATLSIN